MCIHYRHKFDCVAYNVVCNRHKDGLYDMYTVILTQTYKYTTRAFYSPLRTFANSQQSESNTSNSSACIHKHSSLSMESAHEKIVKYFGTFTMTDLTVARNVNFWKLYRNFIGLKTS